MQVTTDLKGGAERAGRTPPLSGIRPPADPKDPPSYNFEPKNFPKAPIYITFEGGARAKKRKFLVKIFQKVPKNAFFGQRRRKFGRKWVFKVVCESPENQFRRSKKSRPKISNFFFENLSLPSRENSGSALYAGQICLNYNN